MKTGTILTLIAFACVCAFTGCAATETQPVSYNGKNIGEVLGKPGDDVFLLLGTKIDDEHWGLLTMLNKKIFEVDAKGVLNGPILLHISGGQENGQPYRISRVAPAALANFLELQKNHTQYLGGNIGKAVADKGLPVAAVGYDITTDKRLMMGGSEAADWFAAQGKMRSAAVAKITFADGSAFLVDSAGTIVFEE